MIDNRINLSIIGYIGADAIETSKKDKKELFFTCGIPQSSGESIWYHCYLHFPLSKQLKITEHLKKGVQIKIEGRPDYKSWAKVNEKKNAILVDNLPIINTRNYLIGDPSSLLILNKTS